MYGYSPLIIRPLKLTPNDSFRGRVHFNLFPAAIIDVQFKSHGNSSTSQRAAARCSFIRKRSHEALTFVKALLTVHDGNPVSPEAGGPMELTVVLVQLPIGTTHWLVVGFTVIQALAVPLAGLMVDDTVTSQATVFVFTCARIADVSHKT